MVYSKFLGCQSEIFSCFFGDENEQNFAFPINCQSDLTFICDWSEMNELQSFCSELVLWLAKNVGWPRLSFTCTAMYLQINSRGIKCYYMYMYDHIKSHANHCLTVVTDSHAYRLVCEENKICTYTCSLEIIK